MDYLIFSCPSCSQQFKIAHRNFTFICPNCGEQHIFIDGQPFIAGQAFINRQADSVQEKEKPERTKKTRSPRKRKTLLYTLLGIVLLIIGGIIYSKSNQPQNIYETLAFAKKDSIWTDFREKYQYQYQMVGLKKFEDNSNLLIISEPPTHITKESIEDFFDNYNSDLSIIQHRVGYDGWVKDVVVCINGLNEKKFDKMLSKLQTKLFHTDYKYKSYTISLDSMPEEQFFLSENLNLQVSSDELYNWFIKDGEKLLKLNSKNELETESKTLQDIFNEFSDGIYFSENSGLVVWILPKNKDLSNKKEDARKFTIDSDIILGAISNDNYVAIIGREREISVLESPPLRVETLLLLSQNSDKDELAQSFEYDMWFLGKQKNHKDWYFAWLCDELINTEYGNLLNWTDHVLKGWTDNNSLMCDYINFPNPFEKPFEKPLFDILKCNSLVYNWSSKNLTYSFDYDDIYDIQATLGGTGCLPITYIPEWSDKKDSISIEPYKEDGYDYFSNLNNPNIARVVQYQTIYQIFQNCNIYSYDKHHVYRDKNFNRTSLHNNSIQLFNKIISLSDDEMENIAKNSLEKIKNYNADKLKEYEKYFVFLKILYSLYYDYELTTEQKEFKKQLSKCNDYIDYFTYLRIEDLKYLKDYFQNFDETQRRLLAKSICLSRRSEQDIDILNEILENEPSETYYSHSLTNISDTKSMKNRLTDYLATDKEKINGLLKEFAPYLGFEKNKIKDEFINSQNNNIVSWVKTPLIVETLQCIDSLFAEGGHNLYSRPNKFKFSTELNKGKVIDEGKGVYKIAASEKGNIKGILKTHIKENKIGIRNFYADDAVNIAKNRADVIPSKSRPARGFNPDHLIVRQEANHFTFVTEIGETKIVKDYVQLKDYWVTKNQKATIFFENFNINEIKATISSADISQTARLSKVDLPDLAVDYSTAKYRQISENKFEVTFNFKGKNSNTTLEIKNTPIEKFKNYIDQLGEKNKKIKDIPKDLNIPKHDINEKGQWILELDGTIGKNNINSYNHAEFCGRIMLSSNAA